MSHHRSRASPDPVVLGSSPEVDMARIREVTKHWAEGRVRTGLDNGGMVARDIGQTWCLQFRFKPTLTRGRCAYISAQ